MQGMGVYDWRDNGCHRLLTLALEMEKDRMTGFDEREQSFEARFAHDQTLRFRAIAKRNHRLGHWAAERMGLSGEDAENYAKDVVKADFEEVGDQDVLRKVLGDLTGHGVEIEEAEVRTLMDQFLAEVAAELDAS